MSNLFGTQPGADDERVPRDDRDRALIDAYVGVGRTLDDLAYTTEFETLYERAGADAAWGSRWQALHRLQNLRKAKKLPAIGRAGTSTPIRVTPEDETRLIGLIEAKAGSLGQRDRLLYTPAFEEVVEAFNMSTGRSLTAHDVWRLTAKLAK